MILLCGIPSETPIAMVREALDRTGSRYVEFNQRRVAGVDIAYEIKGNAITGQLRVNGETYPLEQFRGVYTRMMDDQLLPELKQEPASSARRKHSRAVHDAITRWMEVAPARIVNRAGPMGSNFSKPYQAQLIREYGLAVPETLITNDPELARDFIRRHERVIYKSISGIRSIVQMVSEHDLDRLDQIRWCPTQFQAFVDGQNVRVHVIGAEVFATAIVSDATDYRYSNQQTGTSAELTAIQLPDDVSGRCVRLAAGLGLAFAGIDLKIGNNGEVVCFEVNPCPAYSYYEANTGQPIANALARYLAG